MKTPVAVSLAVVLVSCTVAAAAPVPVSPPLLEEAVNTPPGPMPPPGSCRIWYPREHPGQQPPLPRCDGLDRDLSYGEWLF